VRAAASGPSALDMFESICIRHNRDTGSRLDLGLLAEALLYYREVNVFGDQSTLTFLVRTIGPDLLLELLQSKRIKLYYWENLDIVMTRTDLGYGERHRFETADIAQSHLQNVAPELLQDLLGKPGKARRMANRLMSFITPRFFSIDRAQQLPPELMDERALQQAVIEVLRGFVPDYPLPTPFVFRIIRERLPPGAMPPDPRGFDAIPEWPFFRIETNIDFAQCNVLLHRHVPATEMSLTPAFLVAYVRGSSTDLLEASQMAAELALSPIRSAVVKGRLVGILNRRLKSEDTIQAFHDFVLSDAPSVREVVNSGARNFVDVMRLLESADKFKEWIRQRPEEADLRQE